MGISVIALVISLAITLIQTIIEISAANEAEALANEQLAIAEEARAMAEQREHAKLIRAARAQRGAMLAGSAESQAFFASSAQGAIKAVGTNLARERDFINSSSDLADRSDAITAQQIASSRDASVTGAIFTGLGSGISAAASFSSSVSDTPDAFGSGSFSAGFNPAATSPHTFSTIGT